MTVWILFGIFIVGLLYFLYSYQYSAKNYPPGPLRIPFVGNFIQIYNTLDSSNILKAKPWVIFDKISQKYGDVVSLTLGNYYGVVLCSYDSMMDVLNLDDWSYKMTNVFTTVRSWNKELGLVFVADPAIWVEMRKFSQKTLREFGFGKRLSMQSVIEVEISDIVNETKLALEKNNGILTIKTNFVLSIVNVLWCMVAGVRYTHDNPRLQKMVAANFKETKVQNFADPIDMVFPWVRRWVGRVVPFIHSYKHREKVYDKFHNFTKELIDERRQTGIYKIAPENYIDVFLKKIEDTKDDPKSVYTEEQLQLMILDFFQTGTSTTSATLIWGVLYMVLNPEIQKKVQDEIDSIVPRNFIPTVDNIEQMPYTQATLAEIHRISNVVPNPVPRIMYRDCVYRNWKIPKGTHVISNHYSVQMDKEYWGDPHTFRPERFIKDGKFVPDKRVIPFGFGKRYCIAVSLVNSIYPVYFTTLLQKFTFNPLPNKPLPTTEPELGLSLTPFEFQTVVTVRDN